MSRIPDDKDRELVIRLQNGDLDVFELLVDKYKDKSLSLAVSIVKDLSLGEDITQESFIKAFSKIGSFRFHSKFSTWLYRIVVNTSYNRLKKQRFTVPISNNENSIAAVTRPVNEQKLRIEEQRKYIQKALMQLKADEALVLRLFYLCENSLKEIEEITKFSSSKIRVDLHRGRNNLKQKLTLILGEEVDSLL